MADKNTKKRIISLSLTIIIALSSILTGVILGSSKIDAYADSIVVVLDPGHDNKHGGSSANGYSETVVNYKIALACKEALETYDNVTVYLTTDNMQCPFPDCDSRYCNRYRTYRAAELGADLYVSLHNNSGGASGYQIIYPNDNYRPSLATIGYNVACSIASNLDALGLPRHSMYSRNSTEDEQLEENFYPDGSRADYYNVIRNSKYKGVPAVIVEHTFLDNSYDNQFISSDSKIKALGQADAMGIAEYFGLTGGSPTKPYVDPDEGQNTTPAPEPETEESSSTEEETTSATQEESSAYDSSSNPFISVDSSNTLVFTHPNVWQRIHSQWYSLGFRGYFYKTPYTRINILIRSKLTM